MWGAPPSRKFWGSLLREGSGSSRERRPEVGRGPGRLPHGGTRPRGGRVRGGRTLPWRGRGSSLLARRGTFSFFPSGAPPGRAGGVCREPGRVFTGFFLFFPLACFFSTALQVALFPSISSWLVTSDLY